MGGLRITNEVASPEITGAKINNREVKNLMRPWDPSKVPESKFRSTRSSHHTGTARSIPKTPNGPREPDHETQIANDRDLTEPSLAHSQTPSSIPGDEPSLLPEGAQKDVVESPGPRRSPITDSTLLSRAQFRPPPSTSPFTPNANTQEDILVNPVARRNDVSNGNTLGGVNARQRNGGSNGNVGKLPPRKESREDLPLSLARPAHSHDPATRIADDRNRTRILQANAEDAHTLGKHLTSHVSALFSFRMVGPDDDCCPPESWLSAIKAVACEKVPTPTRPSIAFGTDPRDLEHNGALLSSLDFDVEMLMFSQAGTTVWHGSEFRGESALRRVLSRHPMLGYLVSIFQHGMPYLFSRELSEDERYSELSSQVSRGNHKSASSNLEEVSKLLAKDVKHGFCLPFRSSEVRKIKRGMVQPCGIASQFSLQEDGSRIAKERLTHDLSYCLTSADASVNKRVDMELYPEMVYGWCLRRVIHFVVHLRVSHPGVPIFISKFDYSDAYRRVSHAGSAAAQTILVVGDIAYLMLRLAFGGSPNPPCFCAFSEALTDLANELSSSEFEPGDFIIPTVEQKHLVPVPYPNEDDHFRPGIPSAFEITSSLDTRKDCFIDDIINVFLGTEKNLIREGHTVPLAVHLLSRPHSGDDNEPVPRRPLLSPEKLKAEGRPSEIQVCLGWGVNTRTLLVFLPHDKYRAWHQDLRAIHERRKTTVGELHSLIGRLNHASYVVPLSRHFLNTLRLRLDPKNLENPKQVLRLNSEELNDLKTWDGFLTTAHTGISMNLLTFRNPTHLAWSDSCPFGIGGFSLSGRAWRVRIPVDASFRGDDSVNNILEFLGMAISILLLVEHSKDEAFPCLLALGDNTSAIGWISRSGKLRPSSAYYRPVRFIARHMATKSLLAKVQIAGQHLEGDFNDVADLLSFEGSDRGKKNSLTQDRPPNDILTRRILSQYPQLVPEGFKISNLPPDVSSFVCATMQIIESSWTRNKKKDIGASKESGADGLTSSKRLADITPASIEFPETSNSFWSNVSLSDSEKESSTRTEDMLASVRSRWQQQLSKVPLATWLRRFGNVTGTAPCTSRDKTTGLEGYRTPLKDCSPPSRRGTHRPTDKPPPPLTS